MKQKTEEKKVLLSGWVYANQLIQDLKDAKTEGVNYESLLSSVMKNGRIHAPTLASVCDWIGSGYLGDLLAYTNRLDFLKYKKYGDERYQDQDTLLPPTRMSAEEFNNIVAESPAAQKSYRHGV